MVLKGQKVVVLLNSTHVSLAEAIKRVTKESVLKKIIIADKAKKELGLVGKIAVAGLNPHNGENGLFGTEEIEIIAPAVEEAKKIGIDCEGPIVPDSLFKRCVKITFSDGITEITGGFSYQFESLTHIELGNTITSIGGGNFTTFLGTKLEFPASLKVIQGGVFGSCPNLSGLVFHEGLQEIQGGVLNGFQSLDNVVFPESLASKTIMSQGSFDASRYIFPAGSTEPLTISSS